MIDQLKRIIASPGFKERLDMPEAWKTLDIDYHPPRVERVWMPWKDKGEDYRLSLHVIHPCEEGEALLHPHPWKSASYVLGNGGQYEHGIGYIKRYEIDDGDGYRDEMEDYEIVCTQIVNGEMWYEMLDPNGLHYVRPIGLPVYTVFLTGKPEWAHNNDTRREPLKPFDVGRKIEILEIFKSLLK